MASLDRFRAVVGAAVLLLAVGAATGCGGDDKTGLATAADELSADAATPADPGHDEPETTGAATDPDLAEGLPDGFPTDDVPLLREKVLTGSTGTPDGEIAWSVVLQSSRAVSDVSAEVRKEFAAAGYTAGPGNELGDLSVMEFQGPKYDAGVTAARTEGHVVITYVVRDAG